MDSTKYLNKAILFSYGHLYIIRDDVIGKYTDAELIDDNVIDSNGTYELIVSAFSTRDKELHRFRLVNKMGGYENEK